MNNIARKGLPKNDVINMNRIYTDYGKINDEIQKMTKNSTQYIQKSDMIDIMKVLNTHDVRIKALTETVNKKHTPPVETLKRNRESNETDKLNKKITKLENIIRCQKINSDNSKSHKSSDNKHKSANKDADNESDSSIYTDTDSDNSDCEESIYKI